MTCRRRAFERRRGPGAAWPWLADRRSRGAQAAVCAQAGCGAGPRGTVPIPSVGPAYEKDESGVSFYGFTASMPVPIINAGGPVGAAARGGISTASVVLAQTRQRVETQVPSGLGQVARRPRFGASHASAGRTRPQPNHANGTSLRGGRDRHRQAAQVRLRLLDTDNGQLDALWSATQSHADLLDAVGVVSLLGSLVQNPEAIPATKQ